MSLGGNTVIGVDIGHSSIKVVGVRLGRVPKLVGCKLVQIDPQYVQKDGFSNVDVVATALKEAMASAAPKPVHPSAAYVVLPENILFRRVLELPANLTQDELPGVVRLQSAEYLPATVDQMEIDCVPLGILPDGQSQQVMVVAAPKKIVDDYCSVFDRAHLRLQAIDSKPSALARAVIKPNEKDGILLVDIGSEVTTLSIAVGGAIQITSTVNMGAQSLHDPSTGEMDKDKGPALVKRLVAEIAEECSHVTKFYASRSASTSGSIGDIRMSGGGSLVPDINEVLHEQLGLPVSLAQPVISVPPFCDRRFMGALGAALYPLYATD